MKIKKQQTLTIAQMEKIKYLPFNRSYTVRKDLIESMKVGFEGAIILIHTNLISGKWEYYTADGEHRLRTALLLGIRAGYTISERKFDNAAQIVHYVAGLNSAQKSWSVKDYVDSFAYLNYMPYIELNNLAQVNGYSITTCASLLYGLRTRGNINKVIKSGNFVINDRPRFKEVMQIAYKLSKYRRPNNRMILALSQVYKASNWDERKFIANYAKNIDDVLEMSLDSYNDIFTTWTK